MSQHLNVDGFLDHAFRPPIHCTVFLSIHAHSCCTFQVKNRCSSNLQVKPNLYTQNSQFTALSFFLSTVQRIESPLLHSMGLHIIDPFPPFSISQIMTVSNPNSSVSIYIWSALTLPYFGSFVFITNPTSLFSATIILLCYNSFFVSFTHKCNFLFFLC